jgi:hypothetical protein
MRRKKLKAALEICIRMDLTGGQLGNQFKDGELLPFKYHKNIFDG